MTTPKTARGDLRNRALHNCPYTRSHTHTHTPSRGFDTSLHAPHASTLTHRPHEKSLSPTKKPDYPRRRLFACQLRVETSGCTETAERSCWEPHTHTHNSGSFGNNVFPDLKWPTTTRRRSLAAGFRNCVCAMTFSTPVAVCGLFDSLMPLPPLPTPNKGDHDHWHINLAVVVHWNLMLPIQCERARTFCREED